MKDKKKTYLLICCVAAVWGAIFYRVFSGIGAETPEPVSGRSFRQPYFDLVDHAGDTVTLDLSYADPFSEGSVEPVAAITVKTEPVLKPHLPAQKLGTDWSQIVYSGQLYNSVQRRHVAIINVKGHEVMLSEGERGEGLKFIKRVGDSIKVEYHGTSRYLSIK